MESYLHHLAAKKYCNRRVALIQNGTWAPSAAKCMQAILDPLQGIEYVGETITIKTTMSEENRSQIDKLAQELSDRR